MKRCFISLFVLLLTGLMFSCHPEPEEQRPDTVVFGNVEGMIVTTYDTVIDLGGVKKVDLDADGQDDIKIESWYYGSQMFGPDQRLYLYCLSDSVELLGEIIERDSYTSLDTIYEEVGSRVNVISKRIFNTCEPPVSENVTVVSGNIFVLSANEVNDSFDINNCFESKKIDLFLENTSEELAVDESNDTVYINVGVNVWDCANFPSNSEKYVGFKITKDGTPYLGWLKMNLKGNSTVKVHLIETAIQK